MDSVMETVVAPASGSVGVPRSRRPREGGVQGWRPGRQQQQQAAAAPPSPASTAIAKPSRRHAAQTSNPHTLGTMQFARRHRSQGWAGPLVWLSRQELPIG
ncbi:hypothetical protein J1614_011369 [Plenodomus biglobosus]|nr:hypothetical protein J1614_011369 [Plenodomus biglobosus]